MRLKEFFCEPLIMSTSLSAWKIEWPFLVMKLFTSSNSELVSSLLIGFGLVVSGSKSEKR